jgi:hypothetical protein
MKYILSNPYCLPSARILRDEINKLTTERVLVTCRADRIKDTVIRYGNSSPLRDGIVETLNSSRIINLFSNKRNLSELLLTNGIYTPAFRRDLPPESFPVMIRSTLTGKHGIGISVVEDQNVFSQIWKSGFYWTPWIDLNSEFRVHVFNGSILKVFKKEYQGTDKFPIKINDSCHFSLIQSELPKLKDLVTQLTTILGDCFYGGDFGWDKNKKEYLVVELNSAPGLNEYTANLYAKNLVENYF